MAFQLTSPAFDNDATIPRRHTCAGEGLSPPFEWDEPPPGTHSFALLCHDPDAPGGSFWHWAVFDIPPDWRRLPEGLRPVATPVEGLRQAVNDFGRPDSDARSRQVYLLELHGLRLGRPRYRFD